MDAYTHACRPVYTPPGAGAGSLLTRMCLGIGMLWSCTESANKKKKGVSKPATIKAHEPAVLLAAPTALSTHPVRTRQKARLFASYYLQAPHKIPRSAYIAASSCKWLRCVQSTPCRLLLLADERTMSVLYTLRLSSSRSWLCTAPNSTCTQQPPSAQHPG